MRITPEIAVNHAAALARNFRVGNPNVHRDIMADYVADNMVDFMKRADNAHDIADDFGSWYAHAIVNFGA